ncbi:hypothetical protein FA95DRAFT_1402449 [Auriscalpium vulgare]|uniref:Uncharacterized protein n=1 Tax=Auriscalpium vulgare TaxID=40419 RepID=A0ACB8RPU6_9AGAM|nr:hypothetical protein FA95DRAFT_1402449 [Auriscalpium vulgare]
MPRVALMLSAMPSSGTCVGVCVDDESHETETWQHAAAGWRPGGSEDCGAPRQSAAVGCVHESCPRRHLAPSNVLPTSNDPHHCHVPSTFKSLGVRFALPVLDDVLLVARPTLVTLQAPSVGPSAPQFEHIRSSHVAAVSPSFAFAYSSSWSRSLQLIHNPQHLPPELPQPNEPPGKPFAQQLNTVAALALVTFAGLRDPSSR